VDHSVAVATVVNDVHADPHVYVAEDTLLVVLVFASVVQEQAMQELIVVDLGERDELDGGLAVAAEGGFYFRRPALEGRVDNVLARLQV